MFITGRIAMWSPSSVVTTTGRLVIASIVTMPTSGTLRIGITRLVPRYPVLSTVNVPPPKSSSRSLFARARLATSVIARFRPWIDSVSASLITGTISPSSTATATPMLTGAWRGARRRSRWR